MSPKDIAAEELPADPIDALKVLEERRIHLFEMLFSAAEREYPGIEEALSTVLNASERIRSILLVGES